MQAGLAMKVGTYNVRYDNNGDIEARNTWPQRFPVIASLIRFHDFDVLGTQEAFQHQMLDLRKSLPEYDCTSHGRDDGELAGEHLAIFYKKDRYESVETGFFWLSDTPDKPGKGWDASLPRICNWAKLRAKSDGKTFCFFNVHLDHRGAVSRQESIRLILRKIEETAGNDPVYLVGDFNTDQHSEAYQLITGSKLTDTAKTAEVSYLLNGSANKFDPNGKTESRIDHIFVSAGTRVRRFGVLTDSYRIPKIVQDPDQASGNFPADVKFQDYEARLPSDHFPVLAETVDP
jgi:endonuclease/exonuclease/phosphatase family metal-dependent hydrolase